MSDHNNHSLYENSDYPSRRQPTRRREEGERQPRRRRKRRSGGRACHGRKGAGHPAAGRTVHRSAILCCFAAVYIKTVIFPIADLSMDDFPLGENSVMYYQDKDTGEYKEMTTLLNTTSSIWVDYGGHARGPHQRRRGH